MIAGWASGTTNAAELKVLCASDMRPVLQELGPAFEKSSRSEEHTSELQSRFDLVCRLLLDKKHNCAPKLVDCTYLMHFCRIRGFFVQLDFQPDLSYSGADSLTLMSLLAAVAVSYSPDYDLI